MIKRTIKEGTQFHQLLAAMGDKVNQAAKLLQEATRTFQKGEMFDGYQKTYTPKEEGGDLVAGESKEIVTTVDEKLRYVLPFLSDAIDIQLSREASNASGKLVAPLTVEGREFGTFSSQELLQLEKNVRELRNMADLLPTLDMAKAWVTNDNEHTGTFSCPDTKTYRYVERMTPVVLYPHTDKHPAQVEKVMDRVQVGEYSTRLLSGRITPERKAHIIARLDAVLVAIGVARAQANGNVATNISFGDELLNFVFFNK